MTLDISSKDTDGAVVIASDPIGLAAAVLSANRVRLGIKVSPTPGSVSGCVRQKWCLHRTSLSGFPSEATCAIGDARSPDEPGGRSGTAFRYLVLGELCKSL